MKHRHAGFDEETGTKIAAAVNRQSQRNAITCQLRCDLPQR